MEKLKTTNKRLELFHRNFDPEAFVKFKTSIEQVIKESPSVSRLMRRLQAIPGIDFVEYASDEDYEDSDFVPGYESDEEDACDHIVIRCFADFDVSKLDTDAEYVDVNFRIVYNDAKRYGWILEAILRKSRVAYEPAENICVVDLDTHEPTEWLQ